MAIKYRMANDIMERIYDIVKTLEHQHVRLSGVYAIRSSGSQSRGTLARCHALGKIWQLALGIKAVYIIEVLNERFDKLSKEDQDRVLIHEVMHIPKSFGGGFKHHNVVNDKAVEKLYQEYKRLKANGGKFV
jgi:predicted metallopeptidase